MIDHQLDLEKLHSFSESISYIQRSKNITLLQEVYSLAKELNFPIITKDVGNFISLLLTQQRPKVLFEMGSGFGGSLFWYQEVESAQDIYLTEIRKDLLPYYEQLNWQDKFSAKIHYKQQDAFSALEELATPIDFFLIDGQKSSYLRFLKKALEQLAPSGMIAIDNSFWRGSFLDKSITNKSATAIRELHQFIDSLSSKKYAKSFIPFKDGLTLLSRI